MIGGFGFYSQRCGGTKATEGMLRALHACLRAKLFNSFLLFGGKVFPNVTNFSLSIKVTTFRYDLIGSRCVTFPFHHIYFILFYPPPFP